MSRVNRSELADILGKTLATINAWVKEGMPYMRRPGEDDSKHWEFDTVSVIDWMLERVGGGIEDVKLTAEAKRAKLKDTIFTTNLKEIDLNERLGTMVAIDLAIQPTQEMLGVMKSLMLAIPGRCAQQLALETDPKKVLAVLNAEINRAMDVVQTPDILKPRSTKQQ